MTSDFNTSSSTGSTTQNTQAPTISEEYAATRQAAFQAITDLKQKSSSISAALQNYVNHETTEQIWTELTTTDDMDQFRRDLVEDRFEVDRLLKSCTGLDGEINTISKSFDDTLLHINRIASEKQRVELQVGELNTTKQDLEQQLANKQTLIEERAASITTLSKEIDAKNTTISELESEVSQQSASLEQSKADNSTKAGRIQELQTERDQKDVTIKAKDDTITSLQTQISEKDSAYNTKDADLQQKIEALTNIQRTNSEQDTKIKELEDRIRSISADTTTVGNLRAEILQKDQTISAERTTAGNLRAEILQKDQTISAERTTAGNLRADILQKDQTISAERTTAGNLRAEILQKDQTISAERTTAGNLRADILQKDQTISTDASTITGLRAELAQKDQTISTIETTKNGKIQELEDLCQQRLNTIEEHRAEKREYRSREEDLEREVTRLRMQVEIRPPFTFQGGMSQNPTSGTPQSPEYGSSDEDQGSNAHGRLAAILAAHQASADSRRTASSQTLPTSDPLEQGHDSESNLRTSGDAGESSTSGLLEQVQNSGSNLRTSGDAGESPTSGLLEQVQDSGSDLRTSGDAGHSSNLPQTTGDSVPQHPTASQLAAMPQEVLVALRKERGVNRLAIEVMVTFGIWIKDEDYKKMTEAPLTGEALAAFEKELEESKWCTWSDEEYVTARGRGTRGGTVCMWGRTNRSEQTGGGFRQVACETCIGKGRFCFSIHHGRLDGMPVLLPLREEDRVGKGRSDVGFWVSSSGSEAPKAAKSNIPVRVSSRTSKRKSTQLGEDSTPDPATPPEKLSSTRTTRSKRGGKRARDAAALSEDRSLSSIGSTEQDYNDSSSPSSGAEQTQESKSQAQEGKANGSHANGSHTNGSHANGSHANGSHAKENGAQENRAQKGNSRLQKGKTQARSGNTKEDKTKEHKPGFFQRNMPFIKSASSSNLTQNDSTSTTSGLLQKRDSTSTRGSLKRSLSQLLTHRSKSNRSRPATPASAYSVWHPTPSHTSTARSRGFSFTDNASQGPLATMDENEPQDRNEDSRNWLDAVESSDMQPIVRSNSEQDFANQTQRDRKT
jgi:hypothetical protein